MLAKCVLTFVELIWNQRFGDKQTKLNIYHHMLTSSTQLENSLGQIQDLTKGGSDKRPPKAVAPRGIRGHAPPENF